MAIVYRDLLRKALKHTNYTNYLVLSWSMLLVLSAFGRYRMSVHPNEPAGLIVFGYGLIALWVVLIGMTVRERLRARRMVKRHLATPRPPMSAPTV